MFIAFYDNKTKLPSLSPEVSLGY